MEAGALKVPSESMGKSTALDPQFQKAALAKGVDPERLKAPDPEITASSRAPEKIVSTETYLKMHETMNAKPMLKESGTPAQQAPGAEMGMQSQKAKVPEALIPSAVAGSSQKELGLGSRRGALEAEQPKDAGKRGQLDLLAGQPFAGALAQKGEIPKHDVFLPGADKPEQTRSILLAEVGNGVALHARRGGGEMRLVIHPEDMGEVKLKVGAKDGKVEVHVTAENQEVARMIQSGSRELEKSLHEQNLSLAKFEVSVSDSSSVVSTDTKSNLNDQFFSQNQSQNGSFSQGGMTDDGRGARWGGTEHGFRQNGGYASNGEQSGGSASKDLSSSPAKKTRASDSSRRLDVVA